MIVNAKISGWEIIFQQSHGLLAGKIARQWKTSLRPDRWLETLIAITDHDDKQDSWNESRHLTDAGAPMDFSHREPSLERGKSIVDASQTKSRWISLLISKHVSYIYGTINDPDREMKLFVKKQESYQHALTKELNASPSEVQQAYELMQWCDRASLILCKNQLPADERALEVSNGPDHNKHYIILRKDNTLKVDPWPFRKSRFSVAAEARYLSQLKFNTNEELGTALLKAPVLEKEWIFVK